MSQKGFTILEMLVVISVIAILIGIAIPRFKGLQDEANIAKSRAETATLQAAVESFKHNSGNFPANVGVALIGATPQILTSTLSDPFEVAGTPYNYDTNTAGTCYLIWGNGANGISESSINHANCDVTCGGDDLCSTNGVLQ